MNQSFTRGIVAVMALFTLVLAPLAAQREAPMLEPTRWDLFTADADLPFGIGCVETCNIIGRAAAGAGVFEGAELLGSVLGLEESVARNAATVFSLGLASYPMFDSFLTNGATSEDRVDAFATTLELAAYPLQNFAERLFGTAGRILAIGVLTSAELYFAPNRGFAPDNN